MRTRAAWARLEQLSSRTALEARALDARIPRHAACAYPGSEITHCTGTLCLASPRAIDRRSLSAHAARMATRHSEVHVHREVHAPMLGTRYRRRIDLPCELARHLHGPQRRPCAAQRVAQSEPGRRTNFGAWFRRNGPEIHDLAARREQVG